MNRTGLLLLVALLVSSGCARRAPALAAADEASWNRVVAALQQVSEEYREGSTGR